MAEMSGCENILVYKEEDIKKQVSEIVEALKDPNNWKKKTVIDTVTCMKEGE